MVSCDHHQTVSRFSHENKKEVGTGSYSPAYTSYYTYFYQKMTFTRLLAVGQQKV
jgi:hypothetical protein